MVGSSPLTAKLYYRSHGGQVYYKDAFGAMLVYDVSRPQTFETVAKVIMTK